MQIDLIKKEEISKADIQYYASQLDELLKEGSVNPLLLKQHQKALEVLFEQIKGTLTKAAVKECSKYPEKDVALYGATFKIQEAGTKYLYDKCEDPVWEKLKFEFDAAKKALDERQEFLKTIKGSQTLVDEDSGEIITVYQPTKTSQTIVSCSIK